MLRIDMKNLLLRLIWILLLLEGSLLLDMLLLLVLILVLLISSLYFLWLIVLVNTLTRVRGYCLSKQTIDRAPLTATPSQAR